MDDLGVGIVVFVVAFVVVLIYWAINMVMAMKFCRACGHPHPALVWVPLPCVALGTMMQSMNLMGCCWIPYGVAGILGWVLSIVPFLAFIPVLGAILAAVCGIVSFVVGIIFLISFCRTAKAVGRSGILMLLLYMFVPIIGQPLALLLVGNSINTYAEMAYSE